MINIEEYKTKIPPNKLDRIFVLGGGEELEYYEYGHIETDYLKKRDKELARVIDKVGLIRREVIPDIFKALVFSVLSQQVSSKAADTVFFRIKELLGEITPNSVGNAGEERLRACGLSGRKVSYIKGIASAALSGELNPGELSGMTDQEVIKRLCLLPGIGVWTAEMLLIFSMRRPDVVSYGDFGIRRGMIKVYRLEELTREQFMYYKKRYSPYGTVASLYLWEAARPDFERSNYAVHNR